MVVWSNRSCGVVDGGMEYWMVMWSSGWLFVVVDDGVKRWMVVWSSGLYRVKVGVE